MFQVASLPGVLIVDERKQGTLCFHLKHIYCEVGGEISSACLTLNMQLQRNFRLAEGYFLLNLQSLQGSFYGKHTT